MAISGFYTNPSLNYGLLYIIFILHFFISINIGMLIGVTTKSSNAAALMGTIMIIIFLLLGGSFVKTDTLLRYLIPTHYTNEISKFIITEGKGFLFSLPYIVLNFISDIPTQSSFNPRTYLLLSNLLFTISPVIIVPSENVCLTVSPI